MLTPGRIASVMRIKKFLAQSNIHLSCFVNVAGDMSTKRPEASDALARGAQAPLFVTNAVQPVAAASAALVNSGNFELLHALSQLNRGVPVAISQVMPIYRTSVPIMISCSWSDQLYTQFATQTHKHTALPKFRQQTDV